MSKERYQNIETLGKGDTGMLVVATARAETELQPAGWEERMAAIRLTENSQEALNTTTTETWPIIKDRTESIKRFEGHKQEKH